MGEGEFRIHDRALCTRRLATNARACPLRTVGDPTATMNLLQGHDATCPHCWETIDLTLDLSVPDQSYIEDCPVCCRPMFVTYSAADGEVDTLSVEPAA